MNQEPKPTQGVSRLHSLWLVVFGWEAFDGGRGLSHQLGGAALGILFAVLVGTEIRSHRQTHRRQFGHDGQAPLLGTLVVREQDRPRASV